MSGPALRTRHRDSPRTRRAARAAGVDLAAVRPTGAHGRATVADVAAAVAAPVGAAAAAGVVAPVPVPAPADPVIGSSSLLEVDVTALLRRASAAGGAPVRAHLLAEAVASLARAAAAARPAGLPDGPVAVQVLDDDARTVVVHDADLLSASGVVSRLTATSDASAAAPATPAGADDPPAAVLDVVGTAGTGTTTVEVRPLRPGALATLTVGPAGRRPVVVLGPDGEEQIGVRSVLWLALTGADPTLAAALVARVGRDLARPTAAAR